MSHSWAAFVFLIRWNIFTSDFHPGGHQAAQLATVHPAVNVKNMQRNLIRLTIYSECHSHALACFFHVMKAAS